MNIREKAFKMKALSPIVASVGTDVRNEALIAVSKALIEKKDEIFAANEKDLAAAEQKNIEAPVMKRLKFDEGKLADVLGGIDSLG